MKCIIRFCHLILLCIIVFGCSPSLNLCKEYVSFGNSLAGNPDTLRVLMSDSSFVLTSGSSWDLPSIEGSIEFGKKNRFVLKEKKFEITKSVYQENLSSEEVELIVRVFDPYIASTNENLSSPLEVFLDDELIGYVNGGTKSGTIKLSNVRVRDQIIVNNNSNALYHNAVFSVNDYAGKQVHLMLFRVKEINSDYLKMKMRDTYLQSSNGAKFKCSVK